MINAAAFIESSGYLGHHFTIHPFPFDSGQMGHSIRAIRGRPAPADPRAPGAGGSSASFAAGWWSRRARARR